MSTTPDDPKLLPMEFRPESLGGVGRLPVFSMFATNLGQDLQIRRDMRKPGKHAFVEPGKRMLFSQYEQLVYQTAPNWRKENL